MKFLFINKKFEIMYPLISFGSKTSSVYKSIDKRIKDDIFQGN